MNNSFNIILGEIIMKKIVIIAIIALVLINAFGKEESYTIPTNSIRFRVIANSNSLKDQELKMAVVKDLEQSIIPNIEMASTLAESKDLINNNIPLINNTLAKYTDNYNVSFGKNYFPIKEYKGVTYVEGEYESLVVTLGQGSGENFWCVLFPPLCLLEAEETNKNEVEYKSLVKEVIDKVKSNFS